MCRRRHTGSILLVVILAGMAVAGAATVEVVGFEGWQAREGSWRVTEDAARNADPHFQGAALLWTGKAFDAVRLEVEVQITECYWDTESVWAGLLVRGRNVLTDGPWGGGYKLFIRVNGEVVLHCPEAGVLASHQSSLDPRKAPVHLVLEADGPRLRGFVNGAAVLETEHPLHDRGHAALVHYGNAAAFTGVRLKGTNVEQKDVAPVAPEHPRPEPHPPVIPLPAIGVRRVPDAPAEFYRRDTGERFTPNGFNHTVLEEIASGWHATFNVGHYDPEAMEETLRAMAEAGANTLRVWAWGVQKESGFTGGPDSRGLNGAYMENFVDFLRRATRHGLYVVPILDETPHNAYYNSLSDGAEEKLADVAVTGYNRNYLSPGPLAAKAAATTDFVRFVRDADAGLLNTVLGWAFANEAFVNHSQGPFSAGEGLVITSTGRAYDMAVNEQRQACYDETILHWSNTLADAVKAVAPEALTTVGMWTSDAHDRPPVNYLLPDDRDPRRPPRPSVLAGPDSRIDFLDIHIYPWDGTSRVRPEAHEADAVMASPKPAIVGEYGVFKRNTIEEARVMMREMLEQAYALGYRGSLHWVWDLSAVDGQTWSAVEEGLAQWLMDLDVHPR